MVRLGIDVGSTTVKLVLLDDDNNIVYSKYERHMSNVFEKAGELIKELRDLEGNLSVRPVITGSGGLSLADLFGIRFEQEVIACSKAVEELITGHGWGHLWYLYLLIGLYVMLPFYRIIAELLGSRK